MDLADPNTHNKNSVYQRHFWIFLSVLFVWRLIFVAISPLDLVPDESYYWDWSRIPDWGYYSKPPMVAWVNLVSDSLLGTSQFAVRFPAVIFSTIALCALFFIAQSMFDSKTAFWSCVAAVASPGNTALGYFMTIDVLLLCFWSLALFTIWQALNREEIEHAPKTGIWWWTLTMIFIGLGMLSKQMMMIIPLLLLIFLALSPADRSVLKTPRLYAALFGSFTFLLPVLWWNMQNEWITLQHTSHHFAGSSGSPFRFLVTFFEFLGGQFLIISPITFFLFITVAFTLSLRFFDQDRRVRMLLVFSILALVVVALLSFRQRINANWPAAFYPAGMILTAAWATGHISCGEKIDPMRKAFIPGILIGALLAIMVYIMPFILPVTGVDGGKHDPTRRLKGWKQVGATVDQVLRETPRPEMTFLLGLRRSFVSQIAFYAPGHPRVYRYSPPNQKPTSQYEMWPGPVNKIGWDCLIVWDYPAPLPSDLSKSFKQVEFLAEYKIPIGSKGTRDIKFYLGRALKHWNL